MCVNQSRQRRSVLRLRAAVTKEHTYLVQGDVGDVAFGIELRLQRFRGGQGGVGRLGELVRVLAEVDLQLGARIDSDYNRTIATTQKR